MVRLQLSLTQFVHSAISLRCPINHLVLLGVIRINLIDLTSAAFISLIPKENAESFQQRCHDYADILAIHPLYLLVVIFEERFETWMEWFAGVWKTVSDIEAVTGMTKVEWMERFPKRRMEEFRNPRTLMKALHGAHVELAHCTTIMAFAKRFGTTSKMCIEDFEGAREQLGLDPLNKGKRTKLERRLRVTVGKFEAMVDRVEEMKARLKGQIDVVCLSFPVLIYSFFRHGLSSLLTFSLLPAGL
jgi:hypothetical protein